MDASSLDQIKSLSEQDKLFVVIAGEKSYETGMQDISQTKSKSTGKVTNEEIKADYIVLAVADRFLIVKADHGHQNETTFTGSLDPIPNDVYQSLILKSEKDSPKIKDSFYPFMLNGGNYRYHGYLDLIFGFPLFLLGLWNIKKALQRINDYKSHPIIKTISKYGDLPSVSSAFEAELQQGVRKFGGVVGRKVELTKSWIFNKTFFGLNIVRLDALAWVYKKVTKRSVNFVPTGKTYAVIINSQFGDKFEMQMSEKIVNEFLETVEAKAPWAFLGYSDELNTLWEKQRQSFYQAVEERKKQSRRTNPV